MTNLTSVSKNYYRNLKKSPLTPKDYVFGVVWPILYLLLIYYFISLITHKNCVKICVPIIPFLIQMVLNLSWSPVFFRYKKIRLALLINIAMIILTLITMYLNLRIDAKLNYLLIPYLGWITFAAYLNGYIVWYN